MVVKLLMLLLAGVEGNADYLYIVVLNLLLEVLTQVAARDLADKGITVNVHQVLLKHQ